MKKFLLTLLVFYSSLVFAQTYTIKTVAGDSVQGFSGDNSQATSAELFWPSGLILDGAGNMYIADQRNNRIRKISAGGVITTIAGTSTAGYTGDNIAATTAGLYWPLSVDVDAIGNIYIADQVDIRIRKVSASGLITTIAGNGTSGFSGDNGPATSAEIDAPSCIVLDGVGNIYFADDGNQRIRKITTTGIITTIAGNGTAGFAGDSGAATAAELHNPYGVAVDGTGNVYIADYNNDRVRKVNTLGIISTIAGNGTVGFTGDNGAATDAELHWPIGVAVDGSGNVYIADQSNNRIRKINTGGIITTIAGNGTLGFTGDSGIATSAELDNPSDIVIDGAGNIYIADEYNNRIRELNLVTGINEISNNDGDIKVSHNPSNGIFNITLQNPTRKYNVIVYNMLGQEVYTAPLNLTTSQIDLSNNPTGLYLYRVISKDGNLLGSGKLVKE